MSFFSTLLLWCDAAEVRAQEPGLEQFATFSSTPNPVGSGARAMGMGGAFIAVADDATAASWNPGGLTQLRKPEFSIVYSHFSRGDRLHSNKSLVVYSDRGPSSTEFLNPSGSNSISSDDLNYFSIAYPFELFQRNMIISLNYQLLYDFDRTLNTHTVDIGYQTLPDGISIPLVSDQIARYKQRGKLRALSPAYAIQITPQFSLGVTLNFWTDKLFWSNAWESDVSIKGNQVSRNKLLASYSYTLHERYSGFSGFNMNIGFLWHVNRVVTIGGVLKTPFTADVKHTRQDETFVWPRTGPAFSDSKHFSEHVDITMPLSFGFGIALRLTDAFTTSLDVYRTEWNNFVLDDSQGKRYSPITAKLSNKSHVGATTQVRLGAEYLFILTNTVIPVRGGLFYDPEPANKHPEDFWGIALGTGVSIKNVILDIAYQYRRGNNVGKQAYTGIPGAKADVTQHLILASIIYHFE